MSELYVVRHGQASFGAKNYDKLSQLGIQQSHWLGEYFLERNISFSHLWMGDMLRHEETANGIVSKLDTTPEVNVGNELNEFDFQNIGKAYVNLYPEEALSDSPKPADFYRLLKKAMHAWADNKLPQSELKESWQDFESRVQNVLDTISQRQSDKPILIVSSGGAISMLTCLVLGLDLKQVIELNMQIRNSSISHFYYNSNVVRLSSFNNVPHLDRLDRLNSITFS